MDASARERPEIGAARLPIHGFVLAGGQSLRMGRDKARLEFGGVPMVQIACEKLREFCAEVSIAGNREDLGGFAPVVREERVECGPAAGVEAALRACKEPWAMVLPVDVPLVPAGVLRRWAEEVLARPGTSASYLYADGEQPSFCMVRAVLAARYSAALEGGERRLRGLLSMAVERPEGMWVCDAAAFCEGTQAERAEAVREWFRNLNSEQELAEAEGRLR